MNQGCLRATLAKRLNQTRVIKVDLGVHTNLRPQARTQVSVQSGLEVSPQSPDFNDYKITLNILSLQAEIGGYSRELRCLNSASSKRGTYICSSPSKHPNNITSATAPHCTCSVYCNYGNQPAPWKCWLACPARVSAECHQSNARCGRLASPAPPHQFP